MKKVFKWLSGFIMLWIVIVLAIIGPIDRTPLESQPFYKAMMAQLDTLQLSTYPAREKLKIGWSEVNITPDHPMPLAGYTLREHFETVHDSLYARILHISNGSVSSFIIAADLLLFPPVLKQRLQEKLNEQGSNDFLYFAGTHTHNGVGGWNESLAGKFILGEFDEVWVRTVTAGILEQMAVAKSKSLPATLSYWEASALNYVENRIVGDAGLVDGKLRGLKIVREDSSKALVISYSAHPTSISKTSKALSGDYPSALIEKIEREGYEFGLFMAGMVGSHRWRAPQLTDFDLVNQEADILSEKSIHAGTDTAQHQVSIAAARIPLVLGPSQMRIGKNWKVRDWAFRAMLGELKAEITCLEIGNTVLLGTSCDFSGELNIAGKLDAYAASKGKHLIITSFNGDYTGYITLDERYDQVNKEELRALNWVGPYYGSYYTQVIKKIIK